MTFTPSAAQLEAFDRWPGQRPVSLFIECRIERGQRQDALRLLEAAGAVQGGVVRWAGCHEETLTGPLVPYDFAALLEFRRRADARTFSLSAELRRALQASTDTRICAVSRQARALAMTSRLFAAVLPKLRFDNTTEEGDEVAGDDPSIIPSAEVRAALAVHPAAQQPVTMINWLKFRAAANYPAGAAPATGKQAYLRYGKVALLTTHSLGGKLIYASRFQQVLVGNGGDPGLAQWDEFALMQYPGRATFMRMTTLKRYRASLGHRAAGLAPNGQGLCASRALDAFVWRG